jgi:hypothetical protein
MGEAINMVTFIDALSERERDRACILFTHEFEDQKEWAAALAEKTDSDHIDLLEQFHTSESLSSTIRDFTIKTFFEYVQKQSRKPVLIISGIEFLKATWSGLHDYAELIAGKVQTWDKRPALLLVMQYDKKLARYPFSNRFGGHLYTIDRRETLAL